MSEFCEFLSCELWCFGIKKIKFNFAQFQRSMRFCHSLIKVHPQVYSFILLENIYLLKKSSYKQNFKDKSKSVAAKVSLNCILTWKQKCRIAEYSAENIILTKALSIFKSINKLKNVISIWWLSQQFISVQGLTDWKVKHTWLIK